MLNKISRKLSRMQIIAMGFFLIIMTGTILLMLPCASKDGNSAGFINSLFTATSSTCVTGLVVVDTYQQWTIFGQIVIITMIQIGGLGFITIGMFMAVIFKRKIGLSQREMLHESVSTLNVSGMVKLTKKIIIGTICFEGIGAFILTLQFLKDFGLAKSIYFGIFHSISAFCNAGFDLMGTNEAYSSLTTYVGSPTVNITVMSLIIIGGIGFLVWDDVWKNKFNYKKYLLHTKIVICVTLILIIGGALLFFIFESNNLFKDMPLGTQVLSSFFASVTPRTAGFNTVDLAAMSDSSKLLTMILMFIGGSPGSTAGGIKTTTILVILLTMISMIRRESGLNIFKRRISEEELKKATMVLFINLGFIIIVTLLICSIQDLNLTDVLLETFSAMGTVGMSTGITRELNTVSRLAIIMLMYCGRIGSLSFALSFSDKKNRQPVLMPTEKINIG